jgi:serine/threonine protein kinase
VDGYRLLGRLGEGGQGRVFLAEGPDGGRVALKVLLPEVASDPATRARIADQLELTRHLPEAAVVRLFVARVDAEPPYLVSEYVPGPSPADRVRGAGPLAGPALDGLMTRALDALAAIHRAGVVHNDLKPANILLGPDGPRFADFDLALRIGTRDPTANEDGVMGSAAFLAPERLDAGPAIRASDVFAWAATMVYAGTGRSPFHAADMSGVVRAIEHDAPDLAGMPARTVSLLQACLDKDPLRRPTVDKVVDRLAAALRPDGPASPPSAPPGSAVPAWGTPAPDDDPDEAASASPPPAPRSLGVLPALLYLLLFLLIVLTFGHLGLG